MLRWLFAAALFACANIVHAKSEDVQYRNGDVSLAAELILPEAHSSKLPAVVIIQGSGSSDRSNDWARSIAEVFVSNGFATLLTDKRGSGKSSGNWKTSGFDDLAGDAIAGVQYLRSRSDIDASKIGVAGLSQGGRVAPVAAAKFNQIRFVVSIVTDAVTFPEQSFIEMANTSRQAGLGPDEVRKVLALNAAAGRFLMGGSWDDYATMREDMLRGPAAKIATGFPDSRDAPIWKFLSKVYAFDPLPYWMSLQQPSVVILGAKDEQDNVPVAETVHRLEFAKNAADKQNIDLIVLPGLGHSLLVEPGTLAPAFVGALGNWLHRKVLS